MYIVEIDWDEERDGKIDEGKMEVIGVDIQGFITQRYCGEISVKLALPLGYPF